MQSLSQQFYLWTKNLASSRFSQLIIFLCFFLDACVFPFPTTFIFITISLISSTNIYVNAIIATLGMVIGSVAGYFIGHYLWLLPDGNFTQMANWLFNHVPGFTTHNYQSIQSLYSNWGYWILFLSVVLPLPYQFYSITAGVFDFSLITFSFLTLLFHGTRFFVVSWLTIRFGDGVKTIFNKNPKIIITGSILILVILFVSMLFGLRIQ